MNKDIKSFFEKDYIENDVKKVKDDIDLVFNKIKQNSIKKQGKLNMLKLELEQYEKNKN